MPLLDYLYPLQFANIPGLWALLSIIPLILIYLLRPRRVKIQIPSLMFLLQLDKEKRRFRVLRKLIKDPLFLLQLLVLLLVSLAVASPFIMGSEEKGGGQTVIIIDASGSMQADNRFEKARAEAKNYFSSRNSIILAESLPVLIVRDVPSSTASNAVSEIRPGATSADLASAIMLAKRMLLEGGRIVVISDFISWTGDDPVVAKKIAESAGISVVLVPVDGRTDNTGIVDGWFEPGGDYRLTIKNFNDKPESVPIEVTTGGKSLLSDVLNIDAKSSNSFAIHDIGKGLTEITIRSDDALPLDNRAYVYFPSTIERKVLFISGGVTPSLIALQLPEMNTDLTVAGRVPSASDLNNYPIVIVTNITLQQNDTEILSDYVKNGGNLVVIASGGLQDSDMLPVELQGIGNKTGLTIALPTRITEGIDVGKIDVSRHFKAGAKSGATVFVTGGDGSPMLAYWKFGKGTVIYSGLADPQGGNIYDPLNPDVWNDFHTRPDYPLFWRQMLEWLAGSADVSDYNAKTGTVLRFATVDKINTPAGIVTTDVLLMDQAGVYELPDKMMAANMYSERESNLERTVDITKEETQAAGTGELPYNIQVVRVPKPIDVYLIIAAMVFIFLELYYLRWRGEL